MKIPEILHVVTVAWHDGETTEYPFAIRESAIAFRNRKRKDPRARSVTLEDPKPKSEVELIGGDVEKSAQIC